MSDPAGDNGSGFDPRGDIVDTVIVSNTTDIGVGTSTEIFDDPSTSDNWTSGATAVEWGLDVNHDGQPDFIAIMFNDTVDGLGVIAGVVDGTATTELCAASPGWDAADNGYLVQFARSCIDSPAKVQVQGFMDYETTSTSSIDITNWSAAVVPSVPKPPVTKQTPISGYWMLGADGHVYGFGAAVSFGGLVPGAKAMAPRHDGKGYWVIDGRGHVFTYGMAAYFGGAPSLGIGEIVSTISATPNNGGYWLFTNRGRAIPFGNAGFFGDMSGAHLNGPIVASVATATGKGYYMVGSDGGIFSFGDAKFHGSTGGIHLNKPIVGISPTANGKGYWLVGSDGGVFAFSAPFLGSMGGTKLNRPVDGLVGFGNGYLMAASDGGIFDFSNKAFDGSLANNPPSAPIIGLAAVSS